MSCPKCVPSRRDGILPAVIEKYLPAIVKNKLLAEKKNLQPLPHNQATSFISKNINPTSSMETYQLPEYLENNSNLQIEMTKQHSHPIPLHRDLIDYKSLSIEVKSKKTRYVRCELCNGVGAIPKYHSLGLLIDIKCPDCEGYGVTRIYE